MHTLGLHDTRVILGIHMFVTFKDSQPWAFDGSEDFFPDSADTLRPRYGLGVRLSHCNLPFSLL